MDDHEIWQLERTLWLGDAGEIAACLGDSCLMAFASGLIDGRAAAIVSLGMLPAWTDVEISETRMTHFQFGAVLGYRAMGLRPGETPYSAICTSTWLYALTGPCLIQHQQTPLALP